MKNKIIDSLYLFSSVFMIGLLLFILFHSLSFWTSNFPDNLGIEEKAFYIAVGIAIVTSIASWIEGRIKSIIVTVNNFSKGGVKYGTNRKSS